jgi:hypothetical protein
MTKTKLDLFNNVKVINPLKTYKPLLTAVENQKGVLDVDTVKGCELGMKSSPKGGCYNDCYANKIAKRYGIDFSVSVSRKLTSFNKIDIFCTVRDFYATWYRVGTMGDPCHDWENTLEVCEYLKQTGKTPVIITKHWIKLTDNQIKRFKLIGAVFNTSVSGLDSDAQIKYRVNQINRLKNAGLKSIARVVSCKYGITDWALKANKKQDYLMTLSHVIDNPLRTEKTNKHFLKGDILLEKRNDSVGGGKLVSINNANTYLGSCKNCPDQCGVDVTKLKLKENKMDMTVHKDQTALFEDVIEWVYVKSVLGSGFEEDVSRLAIDDGIAKRAARKNMQIHSAIILKVNDEFSGFFTFQVNDVSKEFCLLQSVIEPQIYTKELYAQMVREVLAQRPDGYPAMITTDPKSKFETPALFESVGFQTYLKMSGYHYMVNGPLETMRLKLLAHITMTNVWNTVKGDWLRLKSEWRERIDAAGEANGVPNPSYATREGCWQGENGMSNVVNAKKKINENGEIETTTKSHNGNASVLDPVACEVIARMFMPKNGNRIYNPFGGGVQMGYVAGACGYEYYASEIRKNQSDANNLICSEFDGRVKWVQSDSSTHDPDGNFDLIFTCPPYYKVERYVDYDGNPPEGELNSFGTYEEFRDLLFKGYKKAIEHLNDNCFFVVMTGDSRDKKGAYHCHEAETVVFFKENGLSVYNQIVYVECEFTRLAHAKKTLHTRKFPKREQKIIVAFKGDISKIKDNFEPLGRL